MSIDVFNILKNLSKKKQKPYCKYLVDSLCFDYSNNIRLCPYSNIGIIMDDFNGLWLDVDKLKAIRSSIEKEFFEGNNTDACKGCCFLSNKNYENNKPLKYLYLSNWKYCYLNCIYCDFPKEEDLIKANHYDLMPIIQQLIDNKIIDVNTKVIFDCGDATVHPEFDKILYFFMNFELKNVIINTPALRYCESISEAIAKNIAEVVVSFDSGCPYIYEKIKGANKFDIAINNIKRYLSFQEPSEKRVVLKYTLLSGINDNQKELLDWFMLARDLRIKKLALDIDLKWYNQIKNSIPQYLKEIIDFTKKMSSYNNIEIEFSDSIQIICSGD